ncbi:MAG: ABC transporter ATP-binding protein [Alicyclobacillaceae bacterium]|nr:ABC transporter ATP-binding protein [Alicyclobacillaceae bacterium]
MLELAGVSRWYHTRNQVIHVLNGIDLSIDTGEFVCLLGPSGCGKSTLLKIIAGIEPANRGKVLCRGRPIQGPGRDRAVVFQQPALFPWLNVWDNVAFGLKMQRVPRALRQRIVERYLELAGLSAARRLRTYELSGGMKQRVAIARVLATDPSVVLMDEPFGALDAFTKEQMQDLLRNVWRTTRKTVFFITHDVEEALFLATRVVVLSPRPAVILCDRTCPFSTHGDADGRVVRSSPEFIRMREEIIGLIRGAQAAPF